MYEVIPVLSSDDERSDEMTPIMLFPAGETAHAAKEPTAEAAAKEPTAEAAAKEPAAGAAAKEPAAEERAAEETLSDGDSPDVLLSDIEAFRSYAQRLQSAISERRDEADALAKEVQLQKEEALALAQTIAERKAEADTLAGSVESQVDRVMKSLEHNMTMLDRRVEAQVRDNRTSAEAQTRAIDGSLSEMKNRIDASALEIREQIVSLHSEMTDLSGKVHSENVQSFRNMKDVVAGLDHHAEDTETLKAQFAGLRKRFGVLIFLGVANLAALAAVLAYLAGVLPL